MENAINTLRIQNFKSIKDVTMQPRRVNLIIGPPNVGKSNILEAMSLLGGISHEKKDKFMGSFIRYEEPRQMFYDNLVSSVIRVETDKDLAVIGKKSTGRFGYLYANMLFYNSISETGGVYKKEREIKKEKLDTGKLEFIFDAAIKRSRNLLNDGSFIYTEFGNSGKFGLNEKTKNYLADLEYYANVPMKSYVFSNAVAVGSEYNFSYLNPPHGDNLVNIIQALPEFRKQVAQMFNEYGLKLLLRVDERRLEVIKDLEGVIYSYPYSSIADTLQRIIFYLAAIESNDDAVILLEEPEAHSYPTYVSMLGQRIVESSNNQFFVATHSPYLITEVLENMVPDDELAKELAIFVAYYEEYQTKVKQLSDEEVKAIRYDSLDVFYNMNRYIPRND